MEHQFWQYYQDVHLDKMRQATDPVADQVIQTLFEEGQASSFKQLMASIQYNQDLVKAPIKLPEVAQNYFSSQQDLPNWADTRKLQDGQKFFAKNAQNILSMLGFLSLPYCYAAANGAQVLYFSERIYKNTQRRLIETAQFVLDVTAKNALVDQNEKALASILKVRLMHAAVRYHLQQSDEWQNTWGVPINQEDMAGTNLAFSWIVLRGLRRIGLSITNKERETFLHLWNVIGFLLGVREEMLPQNAKAAFWLDKQIAKRQFRSSKAGQVLSQSLIKCLEASPVSVNLPDGFVPSYLRFLLGEEIADSLNIPSENWTSNLLHINNLRNRMLAPTGQSEQSIRQSIAAEIQQNTVNFSIPLSLRN